MRHFSAFLPAVNIAGVDFWDGGVLNNNPVYKVWEARYDLAPPLPENEDEVAGEPFVACVVSIGTGYHSEREELPRDIFSTIGATVSYSTNVKAKDRDFGHHLKRWNLRKPKDQRTEYFRLDSRIQEAVNLDDYQSMDRLEQQTREWLGNEDCKSLIRQCADVLRW